MKGRTQTTEAKLKMSKARKGIAKPRVDCPNCSNSVAINTAKRWHFDNCKTLENK
jgi:ribosomal protein S27AE